MSFHGLEYSDCEHPISLCRRTIQDRHLDTKSIQLGTTPTAEGDKAIVFLQSKGSANVLYSSDKTSLSASRADDSVAHSLWQKPNFLSIISTDCCSTLCRNHKLQTPLLLVHHMSDHIRQTPDGPPDPQMQISQANPLLLVLIKMPMEPSSTPLQHLQPCPP